MPDSADLAALLEQVDVLEERYQAWVAPINEALHERMFKVGRDGYTGADMRREMDALRKAQRAKYDPYRAMYDLFDELCLAYLVATPGQRARIRGAVRGKAGIMSGLLGYAYHAAKQLRSPADSQWLRKGLAAMSIEDCGPDYRDSLLALAELYVIAERAGIRPRAEFKAMARLSSSEKPRGGMKSVSEMLANFHRYGVLKERRGKRR